MSDKESDTKHEVDPYLMNGSAGCLSAGPPIIDNNDSMILPVDEKLNEERPKSHRLKQWFC